MPESRGRKKKGKRPPRGRIGSRSGPRSFSAATPATQAEEDLSDPRQVLDLVSSFSPSDEPLDIAQGLIYQAWEAPTAARRVALARRALDVSPDCADAYVILAQAAKRVEDEIDLYRQGVAAGERALSPRAFEEDAGYFWGLLETRPYMRARLGLAVALWQLGEREETIAHFRELLRLNPNDNQGVRELLLASLLVMGRDQEAQELLDRPEYEGSAMASWAYGRVLVAFRQEGASERARQLLSQALELNAHIPSYLLGRKPMPKRSPDYVGFGDESEAVAYAEEFLQSWQATPGALRWLAGEVTAGPTSGASRREGEGPGTSGSAGRWRC